MIIELEKIKDIEFDGLDHNDYPEYCDVYISSATIGGNQMTEEEIEWLNDEYPEFVGKSFHG